MVGWRGSQLSVGAELHQKLSFGGAARCGILLLYTQRLSKVRRGIYVGGARVFFFSCPPVPILSDDPFFARLAARARAAPIIRYSGGQDYLLFPSRWLFVPATPFGACITCQIYISYIYNISLSYIYLYHMKLFVFFRCSKQHSGITYIE